MNEMCFKEPLFFCPLDDPVGLGPETMVQASISGQYYSCLAFQLICVFQHARTCAHTCSIRLFYLYNGLLNVLLFV